MISVNLMGRLGNNLFQVACAMSIANRHGTECHYSTEGNPFTYMEMPNAILSTKRAPGYYREYKYNFNEETASLPDNTHITGYFQSPKYWDGKEDLIRNNFRFKESIMSAINNKFKEQLKDSIGIHIRRGDYLTIQHAHPVCPKTYYEDCIKESGSDGIVFVFSDDIPWCKEAFTGNRFVFIDEGEAISLCLMTMTKVMVIANSTFSWWGAYLNKSAKVFRPRRWFGDTLPYRAADIDYTNCVKDLFPTNWIEK